MLNYNGWAAVLSQQKLGMVVVVVVVVVRFECGLAPVTLTRMHVVEQPAPAPARQVLTQAKMQRIYYPASPSQSKNHTFYVVYTKRTMFFREFSPFPTCYLPLKYVPHLSKSIPSCMYMQTILLETASCSQLVWLQGARVAGDRKRLFRQVMPS